VAIELHLLLVARLALADLGDALLHFLDALGVVAERALARVLDLLDARVCGEERPVAARKLLRRGVLLALTRELRLPGLAGLGLARRVDAAHDRALRAQLLDRHADALARNRGAVVLAAVLVDAAVGLRLRDARHDERREDQHGAGQSPASPHRFPPFEV